MRYQTASEIQVAGERRQQGHLGDDDDGCGAHRAHERDQRADEREEGEERGQIRFEDRQDDEAEHAVQQRQRHLPDHVPPDRGADRIGEASELASTRLRHQLVEAVLHAVERRHEVEGQDQHDDRAGNAVGDGDADCEHTAADRHDVLRVGQKGNHCAEGALHVEDVLRHE